MSDKPRFIRKNGHIIPIFGGKKSGGSRGKNVAAGVGLVAAGVGAAAVSGKIAADAVRAAASFENAARAAPAVGKGKRAAFKLSQGIAVAAQNQLAAEAFWKVNRNVKLGGVLVGAGLIAAGVNRLSKGVLGKDKKGVTSDVAAAAGGAAAALATRTVYSKALSGMTFKDAFTKALLRLKVR